MLSPVFEGCFCRRPRDSLPRVRLVPNQFQIKPLEATREAQNGEIHRSGPTHTPPPCRLLTVGESSCVSILKEEEGKKSIVHTVLKLNGVFFLLEPCAGGAEYGTASGGSDVISRDLDPEDQSTKGSDGVL